jgi:hypothetical protein
MFAAVFAVGRSLPGKFDMVKRWQPQSGKGGPAIFAALRQKLPFDCYSEDFK